MTDKRTKRGPHPQDQAIFGASAVPALQSAAGDYAWLLNRGYAEKSSLKLVGDRYALTHRQRTAIGRATCHNDARAKRKASCAATDALREEELWLDGFNILVTLEAILGGGVLLACRDGVYRDMASMCGTYRKVHDTLPAATMIGEAVESLGVSVCRWFLDSPVSNSGRLKSALTELAHNRQWNWDVQLDRDPDGVLSATNQIIATADSAVLDRCQTWFNLIEYVIEREGLSPWVVDLQSLEGESEPVGVQE